MQKEVYQERVKEALFSFLARKYRDAPVKLKRALRAVSSMEDKNVRLGSQNKKRDLQKADKKR